uniref:Putative tick salivary peptide group 1 n=1 Tax=Ixodes ricinus TaxID=34613 RepID=V5GL17_IXORI
MRAAVLTWVLVGLFFVQEASSKCPDIKRRQQDTNCNYFCPKQAGDGWDEGFLLDGETCNVRMFYAECSRSPRLYVSGSAGLAGGSFALVLDPAVSPTSTPATLTFCFVLGKSSPH